MSLIDDYKKEEQQLIKSFRPVWGYSLLATVCMLAMPIFMFQVYSQILKTRSVESLLAMLAFALVLLVCYGFFDSVRTRLLTRAAVRLETKMAGMLLAGELSRESDPKVLCLRDLTTLRQLASSGAMTAIFDLPMLPLFLAVLFYIHFVLGFVVLLAATFIIILGIWSDRATAYENTEHLKAAVASSQRLEMHLNSQELVRAQGLYREAVRDWGALHRAQLERYISSASKMAQFTGTTKAARQIAQVLLIATGAMLVLMEQASGAVVFAAAMIGGRALQPVEQIVASWRSIKQGYETRLRLLDRIKEISLPVDRTRLPRPKGIIGLERVAYLAQPGTPPIIRGISATIDAGDSVAIIGPSGAGKSTLARLIVGYLIPNAGRITLDGQDLKEWDPTARGLHVGYMPQQITFFDATVRENIARLRKDDPEEWAIDAAKKAGVHELIMRLPQGYDTMIERGKYSPSGGQAQLIALARAFYCNPSILVLDEPNAALDQEGERIFHQAIVGARRAKITTVIVTQRPSVLQYVTKVMLMQNGVIKDYGPKEKVMNSGNVRAVSSPKPNAAQKAVGLKPATHAEAQPEGQTAASPPSSGAPSSGPPSSGPPQGSGPQSDGQQATSKAKKTTATAKNTKAAPKAKEKTARAAEPTTAKPQPDEGTTRKEIDLTEALKKVKTKAKAVKNAPKSTQKKGA